MTGGTRAWDQLDAAAGAWAGHTLSCSRCRGSQAGCETGRALLDAAETAAGRMPGADEERAAEHRDQAQGTLW